MSFRSKSKKRRRDHELEDDPRSQISTEKVARSSAGTESKKLRNGDSDIFVTSEPEDPASQTSSKSARSSSGTKPKGMPNQASTMKAVQLDFIFKPKKRDAQTKRVSCDMSNSGGKESFVSTRGECDPLSESDLENEDDDEDDDDHSPSKRRRNDVHKRVDQPATC